MIYVALYKGTSAMSRSIRWLNWSDYSHAALVTSSETIIEAWAGGGFNGCVREVPFLLSQHKLGTEIDLFAPIGITEEQALAVEKFCRDRIGCPYDWKGVFRFMSRTEPSEDGAWFCSEFIAAAFIVAGFPLLNLSPQKTFPGLLAASPRLQNIESISACERMRRGI